MTNSVDPFAGLRLLAKKYGRHNHARTLTMLDEALGRVTALANPTVGAAVRDASIYGNPAEPEFWGGVKADLRADLDAVAEKVDELEGRLLINMGRVDEFHRFADNLEKALHKDGVGAGGVPKSVNGDTIAAACLDSDHIRPFCVRLFLTSDDDLTRWQDFFACKCLPCGHIELSFQNAYRLEEDAHLFLHRAHEACHLNGTFWGSGEPIANAVEFLKNGIRQRMVVRIKDDLVEVDDIIVEPQFHVSSPSVCPHCHGVKAGAHSPASAKHTEGETPKAGDSRG